MERGLLKSKKGQLGGLQAIVITLVVVGIVLGIGLMVLEQFAAQMTLKSSAQAGVNYTIAALNQVPTWLSIIIILAIVGILLAIVFSVLPKSSTTV